MERSVRELTSAIASGDPEAFSLFYRTHFAAALAEARRCTNRDESFCLDVVQDAMMRVIHSMKTLEDEHSMLAWLRTVVRHCAFDRLRADQRRRTREQAASTSPPIHAAADDMNERLEWLRQQLQNLDADHAALLGMRFRLGWTLQQIGAALGLKSGTVDGRINRILRSLRNIAPVEDPHD